MGSKPQVAPNQAVHMPRTRKLLFDGMAYSLFMDGSIAAELPQGKVKFASVDELQKYLTTR